MACKKSDGAKAEHDQQIERARELCKRQTRAEGLLWSLLRAKQLCGLKFRRQHPVGWCITDIACEQHKLVVELDGEYHDHIQKAGYDREQYLRSLGWDVIRFENEEIEQDADAVLIAIAKHLGLEYTFFKRKHSGSGNKSTS